MRAVEVSSNGRERGERLLEIEELATASKGTASSSTSTGSISHSPNKRTDTTQ